MVKSTSTIQQEKVVKKGIKGLVFVSKNELEQYTKSWQKQLAKKKKIFEY